MKCNNCDTYSVQITEFIGNPSDNNPVTEYYECQNCGDSGEQKINGSDVIYKIGCISEF
jgi:hypothetical protein